MIRWSRMHAALAGVALILVTNAVLLLSVVYNRSGTPGGTLVLSQRELRLPAYAVAGRENSGLALRLEWRVLEDAVGGASRAAASYSGGTPAWLNKAKLAALGFDVSKPADTAEGRLYYRKVLSKEVLLVLELAGPAYQTVLDDARKQLQDAQALRAADPSKKVLEQRVRNATALLSREETQSSRLFVVDAGRDARALRARYPNRTKYALMRGQVSLRIAQIDSRPRLSGYISGLVIDEVNVPRPYRPVFLPWLDRSGQRGTPSTPRYEVSVAFGKRLEPWITAVTVPPGS